MRGDEIRRLRERLGLTQAQAGALVDVHAITWLRWEAEVLYPNDYKAALLWRFSVAAEKASCPSDLGVRMMSLGPIGVLALLLQLSDSAGIKRRQKPRRAGT